MSKIFIARKRSQFERLLDALFTFGLYAALILAAAGITAATIVALLERYDLL